uniref:REF/SRPP-like protein n=1 Tax=Davidia involucrata TaxID=16924 RepID=A0A5B7BYT0_DAVIN
MASNKIEIENSDGELKHLGFARMIAINALVCVSNLYEYAKQNSGPLKSTVGTVESAVTTVVGPVYEKFRGVPGDLLVFLDKKVDEATIKLDKHAPPLAKQVVGQAHFMVQKASEVAQTLLREAQVGGPHAAIDYTGTLCKQLLVSQGARVWYGVNQIPPFHAVANMAVATAACCSEKYNESIAAMTSKGYTVFNYFPLVPIEEMAKAYKQVEATKKGDAGNVVHAK